MLHIILNEIRSCFRNGSTIFFSILFPSLCTFILGTLLENIEVSDSPVGELNIAYCVEDGGYSADTFEEFILSLEEEAVISAEKITPAELGNAAEKYSAAVELNGSEITIYNGSNAVQNRTVKALIDGYNQTAAAYMSVALSNPQALGSIGLSEDSYVQPHDFGRTRTMMDYYAVAMTVVIVFFGSCIAGASAYSDEHSNNTINRLTAAPISKTAVYFGKILGHLPLVLVQVGTVMIVSTLFFGAHFCSTFEENLLLFVMFVCSSLALLAVGVLLNLLFPKMQPWAVLMPVIWVMLFFSGVFQKDIAIKGVSDYFPSRIILDAAFDLTSFSRPERAISVTLWSLTIFAALAVIGCIKVNSRRKNA
ncbi:MAG: ABC transporter permease [Oscillospiraceae bacterium]|nr:ABC transporter permease [Oscillospiraceae bacterium]